MQAAGSMRARVPRLAVLVAATTLLAGCALVESIPVDPDGTLETVSGGVLEVGVSPHPPFTDISGDEPEGTEVALVEAFAASIDAEIAWTVGGEEELVQQLSNGELDLVIGGITEQTPWVTQAAPTRPYAEAVEADGSTAKLVMLTPMGENGFLAALERHLDGEAP